MIDCSYDAGDARSSSEAIALELRTEYASPELSRLQRLHPDVYALIDLERMRDPSYLRYLRSDTHRDFGPAQEGGRGESYRKAQEDALVRARGIEQILSRFDANGGGSCTVLDVLGGDGLVSRVARSHLRSMQLIVTGDASLSMVQSALACGLPAVWQPAEHLVLKTASIDGVLFAYGTHHIDPSARQLACDEAYRVLKPGGRVILHDFEHGSSTARWFDEVVDAWSMTPHPYRHFSQAEMMQLLQRAGFHDVTVQYLYDPFVKEAETREAVLESLSAYLLDMYGLTRLQDRCGRTLVGAVIMGLAYSYFHCDYRALGLPDDFGHPAITISKRDGRWRAELPRIALLASGRKTQ